MLWLVQALQDKKRSEIRAVDNVSFQCRPGKIWPARRQQRRQNHTLRMLATILSPLTAPPPSAAMTSLGTPKSVPASVSSPPPALSWAHRLGICRILRPPQWPREATLKNASTTFLTAWTYGGFDRRCNQLSTARCRKPPSPALVRSPVASSMSHQRRTSWPTTSLHLSRCRNNSKTVIFSTQ